MFGVRLSFYSKRLLTYLLTLLVTEHVQWKDVFSDIVGDKHHPAPLWRFICDVGAASAKVGTHVTFVRIARIVSDRVERRFS